MNRLQILFVQWFPLLIFLSLMMQPHLLHFSAFSMTFIPMVFLLWLFSINSLSPIQVSKSGTILVVLLILSQLSLFAMGDVKNIGPMFLGMVWVVTGWLVYNASKKLRQYSDIFIYSFIVAAVLWMITAAIVWSGLTDGNAITFFGFAVTHIAQPKPTGPFSNGNVFGVMMLCAWIMTIKYWLEGKKYTLLMPFLSLVFLIWVFASMSRGAWVAGSIVFIGIVLHLLQVKRYTYLFSLLVSILLAWWIANEMVLVVSDNLNLADRANEIITLGARLSLYPTVFEIWREHWLFGIGFGNLTGYFLTGQAFVMPYVPEDIHGMGATSSAHNHLLYMLSGAGIAGLLIWIAPTYVLWKNYFSNFFNISSDTWAFLSIALVLWVQGLFNITMNEALPFFLFFMFLGLGVGFDINGTKPITAFALPKRYFQVAVIGMMLGLVIASYHTFKSWTLYRHIAMASVMGPERGQLYKRLFELNNDNIYPYIMNSVVSDFMLIKKGDVQAWAQIQPNIERALNLEEWPTLYQGLFYSYTLQGKWDEACDLAKFLKKQRWKNDKNTETYDKACLQEKVDAFELGW